MSWPVLILISYGALSLITSTIVIAAGIVSNRRRRHLRHPVGLIHREKRDLL